MTYKRNLQQVLVAGLMLSSLGGWLLHLRIHPPGSHPAHFVPFVTVILGVIVVPFLFLSPRLIQYGYLLNGMAVIIGTIMMAHLSLSRLASPFTLGDLIVGTTLADILLLWGKFTLGKALFDLHLGAQHLDQPRKVRTFRYLNMGWWWVHLLGMSLVYYLGHQWWR